VEIFKIGLFLPRIWSFYEDLVLESANRMSKFIKLTENQRFDPDLLSTIYRLDWLSLRISHSGEIERKESPGQAVRIKTRSKNF
jgi:hypothetical protein